MPYHEYLSGGAVEARAICDSSIPPYLAAEEQLKIAMAAREQADLVVKNVMKIRDAAKGKLLEALGNEAHVLDGSVYKRSGFGDVEITRLK